MAALVLLPLLLLVSPASSSYFYMGSSLQFTPKGQDESKKFLLELRTRHTNFMCYQNNFKCALGNCGTIVKSVSHKLSSGVENFAQWCQNEVVTISKFSSNQPFEISYPTNLNLTTGHGYWAQNIQKTEMDWRMKAHVDLGTRTDTGKANFSPVAAMIPFLRVPKNCKRDYQLLVFDPDGDYIRCRVPGSREGYECSMCALPKGFSLLKNTCTIRFEQAAISGLYPIELVLDDFPVQHIYMTYSDGYFTKKCPITLSNRKRRQTVNATHAKPSPPPGHFVSNIGPISTVPEQFAIQVDPFMAESCVDGDYFPTFLTPTPRNGVKIPAYVDRTLEIKVRIMAKNTSLHNFIVTGPENMSHNRTFTDEYLIKWTPTEEDKDKYFPVCFVAEGIDKKKNIYQSELRCFIAVVQSGGTVVTCNDTNMLVEVEKSDYIRRYLQELHLNDYMDPACDLNLKSNKTHLVAAMALHSCGTTVEEDEENIIFKNKITNADPSGIISRHLDIDISFACAYPKRNNMMVGFRHRNIYSFTEKGFGVFTFQFDFYETSVFNKMFDLSYYPLEVSLRQMMYMQIQVTTTVPNAELFVESCTAAPYVKLNTNDTYSIIENGCVIDETVEIFPSPKLMFRFGMEAFEFIDGYDEVYITCVVLLCEEDFTDTRCSQGCITSEKSRRKRDTKAESSRHSISQGPVRIIKPSSSTSHMSGSNLNLGLNMVFIIGCLLVVSLAVHQLRRARAKFLAMQAARA